MGAFFMIRKVPGECQAGLIRELKRQLELQGFENPTKLSSTTVDLFVYRKLVAPLENIVRFENGDFCACVGTLLYEGKTGLDALMLVHARLKDCAFKRSDAYGNYCLVACVDGAVTLRVDKLGIYKTYRNSSSTIWSSSLLAVLSCVETPSINVQSAYEYVFQGATYGNETVIRDVELVDPRDFPDIDASGGGNWPQGSELIHPDPVRLDCRPEDHLAALRSQFQAIASCFGNKIDTALSGGFDSRLTLALLLEQGIRPRVHVYGRETDIDVRVAHQIDKHLGLGLKHIDKTTWPAPAVKEFPTVVNRNFYAFDGCPTDGVFSNEADLQTRKSRSECNFLALNGGGGEIFRNFFYLPDRSFSVKQLLWSFYARFDPRVCTEAFSEGQYFRILGNKIKETLSMRGHIMTRQQIELVYPLFRCRFWMGKNNSVNNRFGPALTPFIEHSTVKAAAGIPLSWKNFGDYEAGMIRKVNLRLASFSSSYGHDFSRRSAVHHRLRDRLVFLRPPIIRKHLYRVKNRLKQRDRPPLLSDEYIGQIIGADFPFMGRLFHIDRISDWEQFNRICTLELLFQKTSPVFEL